MTFKIAASTMLIFGLGLTCAVTANARDRNCCNPCGCDAGVAYVETAQEPGVRRYSYEPSTRSYSGQGLRRSTTPQYLLPKADPRKYR